MDKRKKYMTMDKAWDFAIELGLNNPPTLRAKEIAFSIFPEIGTGYFGKDKYGPYTRKDDKTIYQNEEEKPKKNWPKIILKWRAKARLTQKQLADEMHLSQKAISHWETGKTTPKGIFEEILLEWEKRNAEFLENKEAI